MGHCLRRVRVSYFLKGATMGYGGSEEKMLQDRMGLTARGGKKDFP